MKEIWKEIKHYEGLYEVSNLGRVRSLDRRVLNPKTGVMQLYHGKILAQSDNGRGYLIVSLWKDGKGKSEYVHRLVALTFLPNPYMLPQVNHIDEVKSNNELSNLEWCNSGYNNSYGTKTQRQSETFLNNGSRCNRVNQYTIYGEYIATYRSMREAERVNSLGNGTISAYFRLNQKQCGGYKWTLLN